MSSWSSKKTCWYVLLLGLGILLTWLKPPLRHRSLIGKPDSACLMKPMICSSMNLLFLMSVILQVDGLHCHSAGTAGRGQVTESGQAGDCSPVTLTEK